MTGTRFDTALSIPAGFRFGAVSAHAVSARAAAPMPGLLGPLAAFTGMFRGNGFNTIFRPDNAVTPTAPPVPVGVPRTITVRSTQVQYAQRVFLNFNGLTWPHVSVATLVPAAPVPVPASAFA